MVDRFALGHALFQPAQKGVHHRRVALASEDEGDIDVDAFGGSRGDSRDARLRGRDLDHHIGSVDQGP